MRPHAQTIANLCRRPGAFLTVAHDKRGRGFYLQPGSRRVRAKFAIEAIRAGWLTAKDSGLFGDDPRVWVSPPQPPQYAGEPLARGPSAISQQERHGD
jgi:hypothetical protein